MSKAIQDVTAERKRQISVEGWTPSSDDKYSAEQLQWAAVTYLFAVGDAGYAQRYWPWDTATYKPKGQRENLVRAAALIVAEIERLDRAAGNQKGNGL
ncbi:hypothetical protein AAGQ96_12945 [Pantoea sp. MBD-2R]|uniref:hypothetical protein n=1 Tax=Pantoea sp. MBD-2R TaxID=3141540 RepID=UPI0031832F78